jgi:hypothetical protein
MRNLLAKFTTTEDSTSERFGSTGAYIFVGSSTTAFDSSDNKLLSTSTGGPTAGTVYIKPMDSGFPKRNDGTESTAVNILAYKATFTTSEAVHPWEEWAVKNSSATSTGTGTMFNRALSALGTKANTQSWAFTAKITVST